MGEPGIVNSPSDDYALQDFGNGRRLERMGCWLLDRPAPQASDIPPRLPSWQPDWVYDGPRTASGEWQAVSPQAIEHVQTHADGSRSGAEWSLRVGDQKMHLRLAAGGQLGLYPEHIACWQWLRTTLATAPATTPATTPMLNLFAASGGASTAAARCGAAVTHVDAQQSALELARANLGAAASANPRIIREDAQRFVVRAQRQGRHYPLVVLDPPSFGRGPKGQTWSLSRDLPPMMATLADLLGSHPVGIWLSTHTLGWTPQQLQELLQHSLPDGPPDMRLQAFTLGVRSVDGRILSSGSAATANWHTA